MLEKDLKKEDKREFILDTFFFQLKKRAGKELNCMDLPNSSLCSKIISADSNEGGGRLTHSRSNGMEG